MSEKFQNKYRMVSAPLKNDDYSSNGAKYISDYHSEIKTIMGWGKKING